MAEADAKKAALFPEDVQIGMDNLLSASRHDEKEGWVFNSEISTGIKVYTRDNEDGGPYMVCGIGLIEASPKRVLQEVSNPENWKSWDSMLKDVNIKQLDDEHKLVQLLFHGFWPYGARDVAYIERRVHLEDGTEILATRGVKTDDFPETADYVRASLKAGGWHMAPVEGKENQTMVTYFMNTDPMLAMVPTFIYNWAVTRFPGIIDTVRAAIAKDVKE